MDPSPMDWKAFGVDPGIAMCMGKPNFPQLPAKKKKPWGDDFGIIYGHDDTLVE